MTKKELVKTFIAEVKEMKMLNDVYKKGIIELDDYFKHSGKIESPVIKTEITTINEVKIYNVSLNDEDKIIDYYYRCSNTTLEDISENLRVSVGTIRKVLTKHFENLNKKNNGKNIKNEKCK